MTKKKNFKAAPFRAIRLFLYFLFLFCVVIFGVYHLIYAKAVIRGVYIANQNLGGMTYSGVLDTVSRKSTDVGGINLVYAGKSYKISKSDMDLAYDVPATARSAFNKGRSGDFFKDISDEKEGIFGKVRIGFSYSYDNQKLDDKINSIVNDIETPHKDASFKPGSGGIYIAPEVVGIVVDVGRLKESIGNHLLKADPSSIEIPTYNYSPAITKADLEGLTPTITKLHNNPPFFVFQGSTWKIPPQDFLGMVNVRKDGDKAFLYADKDKVKTFVGSVAEDVNRPPRSEIFKVEGDKVVDFRLPNPGYIVKEFDATEIFSLALLDASMERQIEVPTQEFLPSTSPNSYGIKELVGEGESTFFGSDAGRVHNIEVAAGNLNGILVAPGEVFSFNKMVGPIDLARGFTEAYVISKGRTVLGEGGGVCQVSTTIFRAVLNSGLPIIARTAHAYRVGYYEQDKPVGFDATVYQPSVDFKFKNDMENYVLIQTEVLTKESKLIFRFYGTRDGRTVKIGDPIIFSQTPPPTPLYQDDPNLPKGVVKQVDWPAWGSVVELDRIVEKDGKVLYNDVFRSNYQPWQAVYLMGTKE